jgi:hypothetical protein
MSAIIMEQTIKDEVRVMSPAGSQTTSEEPAAHRRIDKSDVVVVILLLATFIGVAILPFAPQKLGDLVFHREAKVLALAIRGAAPWGEVHIARAPIPVLYYAIPYAVVSPGSDDDTYWRAALIWTVIWMCVSLVLVRRSGEFLGGLAVGKTATLFTLLSPFSVYYSYGILAEPPAYIGVVLFTYAYLRWKSSPRDLSQSRWDVFLLSLGLSIFVLARPNSVLLLLLAGLVGASRLWRGTSKQKLEGRFVLASVLAAVVLIGAVTLSLVRRSGGVGNNSQNENFALVALQGRFQFRSVFWDFNTWPDVPDNVDFQQFSRKLTEFQQTSLQTGIPEPTLRWRWIAGDFLHHPGITLRAAGVKMLALHFAFVHSLEPEKFHFAFLRGVWGYALFHIAVNAFTIVLVIGSVLFVVGHRHAILDYWVLWGPWLALTVFHVMTYAEARYLFPGRPGLVLMASAALVPFVHARFFRRTEPIRVSKPVSASRTVITTP